MNHNHHDRTFRPAKRVIVLHSVFAVPFLAIGASQLWLLGGERSICATTEDRLWLVMELLVLFGLSAYMIGLATTARLIVAERTVEYRTFWSQRWRADRSQASFAREFEGNSPAIPMLLVRDLGTGLTIGKLRLKLFAKEDLDWLEAYLVGNSA